MQWARITRRQAVVGGRRRISVVRSCCNRATPPVPAMFSGIRAGEVSVSIETATLPRRRRNSRPAQIRRHSTMLAQRLRGRAIMRLRLRNLSRSWRLIRTTWTLHTIWIYPDSSGRNSSSLLISREIPATVTIRSRAKTVNRNRTDNSRTGNSRTESRVNKASSNPETLNRTLTRITARTVRVN